MSSHKSQDVVSLSREGGAGMGMGGFWQCLISWGLRGGFLGVHFI